MNGHETSALYAACVTKAALHAVGLAVLLCVLPAAAGQAAAASPPAFREAPCPFPGGEQAAEHDIVCGYVTVPEHRDRAPGRTIELAVAVARSSDKDSEELPVVFLNGGPGDSALFDVAQLWGGSTIRERHDLILLDQRGSGYSRPALKCPGLDYPPDPSWPRAEQELERMALAETCLDDYRADGIDVTAYTTRENAADVESVRQALSIDRWSLYGISYGTRLALEVMRTNGSTVDGAVLDSPYPPQARPFEDASARFERALDATLAACHADQACAEAYPGVGNRLSAILSDADARLDRIQYPPVPAWFAATALNGLFYGPDGIAAVPAVVDGLEHGNAMFVRQGSANWFPDFADATSTGMHYSIECPDRGSAVDADAVARDRAAHTRYGSLEGGIWLKVPVCSAWGAEPPTPDELEPIVSDVPTLILVGAFDPVTPPSYAAETARTLANGTVVELRGLGHAVSLSPCGHELRDAFLADPSAALDLGCAGAMPPPTFSTELAPVPGLPYLLDGMFARSNPTIGHWGLMLIVAFAFASALLGWPLVAAGRAVRARRVRAAPTTEAGPIDRDSAVEATLSPGPEPIGPATPEAARERPIPRPVRLIVLLAIGADLVFAFGLAAVVGAMPEGSLIRALGIPRQDRWLIWLADAGAILGVAVALLAVVAVVQERGRRRSRFHLAFIAFACLLFSGALAYYGILGV